MTPRVSWILLTYNRAEIVKRSVEHNMANAGAEWSEIVWCDNGSSDGVRDFMLPLADTAILHKENRGAAAGYNAAMGHARGDYLVITGSDCLLPDNWLKTFIEHVQDVPGIACMYTKPLDQVPERIFGVEHETNGRRVIPAMAIERRIFHRDVLRDVGYFDEAFFYGFCDICWANRAATLGYFSYVIPGQTAVHLGTEGVVEYDGRDAREYHEMKRREVQDPAKHAILQQRQAQGWPRFSAFL